MANDPQSLFGRSQCYVCFGATEEDALELALLAGIATAVMATDPQSLMDQGKCYACYGLSTVMVMRLALLAQISKNHNAANDTSPAALIAAGACWPCFSNADVGSLMELQLLVQIAT